MNDGMLSGLVERRTDLAKRLHALHNELRRVQGDIAALDGTIRQFDPAYQPGALQPKFQRRPGMAETFSSSRMVLDVLRRAGQPMLVEAITRQIIAENGLDAGEAKLWRDLRKRVGMTLRYQRMNGVVQEAGGSGHFRLWRVAH
jgi:hypothetical protein